MDRAGLDTQTDRDTLKLTLALAPQLLKLWCEPQD